MRLLLDTHVFLWAIESPDRIDRATRAQIADRTNEVFLSTASTWEISIKYALGKLALPLPPPEFLPRQIAGAGLATLPIALEHSLSAGTLPRHHSDPFDRMLIAQALIEDLIIVTADAAFSAYRVQLLRT